MKLCRFELKAEPGAVRSGMVYGGKVYETDGSSAIAVHEAEAVRPLAPIAHPPSIRIFAMDRLPDANDPDGLAFDYANPSAVVGASQLVNYPEHAGDVSVESYLAVIVGNPMYKVSGEDAMNGLLGYTLVNIVLDRGSERAARQAGAPTGQARDVAITVGPVITTPDEFDEVMSEEGGSHLLSVTAQCRVNGIEIAALTELDFPISIGQALAFASQSCTLQPGDLVAFGPLFPVDELPTINAGDEYQISVERLGMLATKITPV